MRWAGGIIIIQGIREKVALRARRVERGEEVEIRTRINTHPTYEPLHGFGWGDWYNAAPGTTTRQFDTTGTCTPCAVYTRAPQAGVGPRHMQPKMRRLGLSRASCSRNLYAHRYTRYVHGSLCIEIHKRPSVYLYTGCLCIYTRARRPCPPL